MSSSSQLHIPGSQSSYLTGFVLAVILTAIPFWLVMGQVFPSRTLTVALVAGFALAQLGVHVVCFLHLNPKSESGWNLTAFVFTCILVLIVITGSLWIMHHLNANMMLEVTDTMVNEQFHNLP